MAEKYRSKYTGKQIDALLDRSANALTESDRASIVAEMKTVIKQEIESSIPSGQDSDVYIGTTEPTDSNVKIWVNP